MKRKIFFKELRKKADFKTMETMLIIFVFFVMLIIGFISYTQFQRQGIEEQARRNLELRAVDLSELTKRPEFRCNDYSAQNCLDLYKITSFSKIISKSDEMMLHYSDLFGYSKINVKIIYPAQSQSENLVYEKKPNKVSAIRKYSIPINLYDAANQRYNFALLEIEYYS
ncbi:MAG: hypothetical protein ACP5OZ_05310 [Candidatus Woesearchaeota archaeon]